MDSSRNLHGKRSGKYSKLFSYCFILPHKKSHKLIKHHLRCLFVISSKTTPSSTPPQIPLTPQSALFKGYLATWLKIGPFTIAQFWVWDTLRGWNNDEYDGQEDIYEAQE